MADEAIIALLETEVTEWPQTVKELSRWIKLGEDLVDDLCIDIGAAETRGQDDNALPRLKERFAIVSANLVALRERRVDQRQAKSRKGRQLPPPADGQQVARRTRSAAARGSQMPPPPPVAPTTKTRSTTAKGAKKRGSLEEEVGEVASKRPRVEEAPPSAVAPPPEAPIASRSEEAQAPPKPLVPTSLAVDNPPGGPKLPPNSLVEPLSSSVIEPPPVSFVDAPPTSLNVDDLPGRPKPLPNSVVEEPGPTQSSSHSVAAENSLVEPPSGSAIEPPPVSFVDAPPTSLNVEDLPGRPKPLPNSLIEEPGPTQSSSQSVTAEKRLDPRQSPPNSLAPKSPVVVDTPLIVFDLPKPQLAINTSDGRPKSPAFIDLSIDTPPASPTAGTIHGVIKQEPTVRVKQEALMNPADMETLLEFENSDDDAHTGKPSKEAEAVSSKHLPSIYTNLSHHQRNAVHQEAQHDMQAFLTFNLPLGASARSWGRRGQPVLAEAAYHSMKLAASVMILSNGRTVCPYHCIHKEPKPADVDTGKPTKVTGVPYPPVRKALRQPSYLERPMRVASDGTLKPPKPNSYNRNFTLERVLEFFIEEPGGVIRMHCGCVLDDVLLDFAFWKRTVIQSASTELVQPMESPLRPRDRLFLTTILDHLHLTLQHIYHYDINGNRVTREDQLVSWMNGIHGELTQRRVKHGKELNEQVAGKKALEYVEIPDVQLGGGGRKGKVSDLDVRHYDLSEGRNDKGKGVAVEDLYSDSDSDDSESIRSPASLVRKLPKSNV